MDLFAFQENAQRMSPVVVNDGGHWEWMLWRTNGRQSSCVLPPFPLLPAVLARVKTLKTKGSAGCSRLAPTVMYASDGGTAKGVIVVSPIMLSTLALESREVQTTRLAPRWDTSRALGESDCTTLQAVKAQSTICIYPIRWERFAKWCKSRDIDPVFCESDSILLFLQSPLETGLTESTLRGM